LNIAVHPESANAIATIGNIISDLFMTLYFSCYFNVISSQTQRGSASLYYKGNKFYLRRVQKSRKAPQIVGRTDKNAGRTDRY
jgi:hypothetical protein